MVNLKRLHQNRSFSIKCSCFGCNKPAITYFACGIVLGSPKKAYMSSTKRLLRVSLKEDIAVPLCGQHVKVMEQYLKEISN